MTGDQLEALGEQIAEHATHIDAATHRLLTAIRLFDAAGGWAKQGAQSMAHWLSWRLRWVGNPARERVRVARALGGLPKIDAAGVGHGGEQAHVLEPYCLAGVTVASHSA